jgi:MFS family permease
VIEGGLEEWTALFLETELDASPAVSGLGPGFFAAAMVCGRLAGQWLEVRLGGRQLLAGGGLTASAGLFLAAVAPSVPIALLGFALGGVGVSVAAPTLFGAAGRGAAPTERGSAVASVTTVSYLGFLAGPPLIGAVSGALDLRAGIGLMAGAALVLAVGATAARQSLPGTPRRHP